MLSNEALKNIPKKIISKIAKSITFSNDLGSSFLVLTAFFSFPENTVQKSKSRAHSVLISSNQTAQGQKNYTFYKLHTFTYSVKACSFRHLFTVKIMPLTTFKIIQMISKLQFIWITYVAQLTFQSKDTGRKRDLSIHFMLLNPIWTKRQSTECPGCFFFFLFNHPTKRKW